MKSNGNWTFSESRLHEEQEREIALEVEREQQVCRPPPYTLLLHKVHEDVRYFVQSGRHSGDKISAAFLPAFMCLCRSSVRNTQFPLSLGPKVFVTHDYLEAVKMKPGELMDSS